MDEVFRTAYPADSGEQARASSPPLLQQAFGLRRRDDEEVGFARFRSERGSGVSRNLRQACQDEFTPVARQSRYEGTNRRLPTPGRLFPAGQCDRRDKLADLLFDELALFLGFDRDHVELGLSRVGPRLLIRRGGLR